MKLTEENLIREQKLGSGSFGVVYSGTYLGTPVAVKVLDKKHHATLDYNHEIAHEVYILKQLRHPNIVILLGVITSEEQILIVEELVENGTLETWIHTNKKVENPSSISFELKLNWSIEIVRALLYMHEKDVIHRDLKSENILIDKNKVAKICDFGLARKLIVKKSNSNNISLSSHSSSDSDITSSNESLDDNRGGLLLSRGVGTLWWRAPEIDTCDHYTNKVDVFSLGIIFAELITHTKGDEIRCSIVKPSKTMDFSISIDMLKDYLDEFALPHCPPEFIQLTIDCCQPEPKERMEMKDVFNRLTGIIKKYDQLAEKVNEVISDKELADNFLSLLRSSNTPDTLIISLDNLISSLSSILSSSDRILNNHDLLALRSLILGNNNNSEEVTTELFVSASNWAKKLSAILDSALVQPFWNERFIHGFVDKNEAEKMIESSPPGTTIFRFRSPFEAGLVATYVKKSGGRICHRLLASFDNNVASFLQQNRADVEFIYPNTSVDSEAIQTLTSLFTSHDGYAMDHE